MNFENFTIQTRKTMEPLIDINTLHQINETQDFSHEGIIVCRVVEKMDSKQKMNSRAILFTELNLHVFKKKSVFRKNHLLAHSYPWHKLVSISIPEEKSFLFTFQETSIQFYVNDAISLVEAIAFHLRDVRIANDMPKLNFDITLLHSPMITPEERRGRKQKLLGKRLRFQAYALDINLPVTFFNTINQYTNRMRIFEDSSSVFDFRNLMSFPQTFDVILYALIGEPSIRSVILPSTPEQKHWISLGKLLKFSKSIKEIETMEQPDETIKTFVEILNSSKNTRLMNLRFRRAEYTEGFVTYLTLLIQHLPKLVELSIEDGLTEKGLESFIDNFNTCAEYERISVLSLRETKGINLSKLIRLAPKIRSLDLRACDIDISTALKEFSRCDIETLNLSENKALAPLDPETKITPTLSKIIVSNVVWLQKNFINFLKFISNAQKEIESGSFYLDISGIKINDASDMQSAISEMKVIPFSYLTTLIFNGNLINSDFLVFLSQCKSLRTLSITDCFLSPGPLYTHFLQILKDSTTLTELVIRTTKDPFSPQMTKSLFDCLKQNSSIRTLDFQDQHQGNSLLAYLKDLVEKNDSIKEIKFDNNSLSSLNALESLVKASIKKKEPIRLEIPKHDILDLVISSPRITDKILYHHISIFRENNNRASACVVPNTKKEKVEINNNDLITEDETSNSINCDSTDTNPEEKDSSITSHIAPLTNKKIIPNIRVAGRRSISDAGQIKTEKFKILTELFDFSAVKKKFIDDDDWCDSQECVPIRNISDFVKCVNDDLTLDGLMSILS